MGLSDLTGLSSCELTLTGGHPSNVLLIFIPIGETKFSHFFHYTRILFGKTTLGSLIHFPSSGWALYLAKHNGGKDISDTVIFIMTFISIIPLAALLGFATEEAAMRLGQMIGGLLNATLGNAVELIVAILALIKVGQSS